MIEEPTPMLDIRTSFVGLISASSNGHTDDIDHRSSNCCQYSLSEGRQLGFKTTHTHKAPVIEYQLIKAQILNPICML